MATPIPTQTVKTPAAAASDQVNPNKGTPGTNRLYDQSQGNRGKQINPNQRKK